MTKPKQRKVRTPAGSARVWEKGPSKGKGKPVGFFAGIGGLPRWLDALDLLAEKRKVVAPSLPGYPGGADYEALDDVYDWTLAACDVQAAAGLEGKDLIGASVGGALAAEVASVRPGAVKKLVLVAPLGLFEEEDPVADLFAQRSDEVPAFLSTRPDDWLAYNEAPNGASPEDWQIIQLRASMAAARLLWPLSDTGLRKRLGRITCPTLILWGAEDRMIPPSYARRFAKLIKGKATVKTIKGAGHNVLFDKPKESAKAIAAFLDG